MDNKNANAPEKEPVYPWGGPSRRFRLPETEEQLEDFYLSAKQELIGRFLIFLAILSALFGLIVHLHYGAVGVAISGFLMGYFAVVKAHRQWYQESSKPLSLVVIAGASVAAWLASVLPSNLARAEGFHSDAVVFIVAVFAFLCAFVSAMLAGQVVRAVTSKN